MEINSARKFFLGIIILLEMQDGGINDSFLTWLLIDGMYLPSLLCEVPGCPLQNFGFMGMKQS